MQHQRFDVIEPIPLTSQDGLLVGTAVFARVGVQTYQTTGGKLVREYRPPEEVKASAIEFVNRPITLNHPPSLLTEDQVEQYIKGITGNVSFVENLLRGQVSIFAKDAIASVRTTHQQLSCGYTCDIENTSGVWVDRLGIMGEKGKEHPYDQIQRNIKGNHLAIVSQARAGDIATFDADYVRKLFNFDGHLELSASTRFDATNTFIVEDSMEQVDMVEMDMGGEYGSMSVPKPVKDMYDKGDMILTKDMVEMDVGGKRMKMPKPVADAVKKMMDMAMKDKTDAEEQLKARKDELKSMASQTVSLDAYNEEKTARQRAEAKRDALESALNDEREKAQSRSDEDAIGKEVQARLDAFKGCKRFLKEEPSFDASKSAIEWKKMAIAAKTPSVKLDDLTPEEVDIRFDMLVQLLPEDDYQRRSQENANNLAQADRILSNATSNPPRSTEKQEVNTKLPQDYRGLIHV